MNGKQAKELFNNLSDDVAIDFILEDSAGGGVSAKGISRISEMGTNAAFAIELPDGYSLMTVDPLGFNIGAATAKSVVTFRMIPPTTRVTIYECSITAPGKEAKGQGESIVAAFDQAWAVAMQW